MLATYKANNPTLPERIAVAAPRERIERFATDIARHGGVADIAIEQEGAAPIGGIAWTDSVDLTARTVTVARPREIVIFTFPEPKPREHEMSTECWCEPTIERLESGASRINHREEAA